ncbi:DUF819 family protein [Flammeovirga agarivorans]|uniref:DUF819 family protein n=1 Tax=Flammeovirga agarivorans TaxID=2726742 RepID=A0A7X8SHT4_9BACT|nr:DUF819 family protein [Flammeovirga agarivorans]NLR90449.1 DUF819 family protein [Flammeovirga agarivorans]
MIQALVMLIAPIFLTIGARKFTWIEKIGTVILAYATGIIMGNSFIEIDTQVSKSLVEAAVPLSIGLLLISSDIKKWAVEARKTILSFVLCLIAITIGATVAYTLFNNQLDEINKLAGMSIGLYIGGTPNMSAIGLALQANDESFILMNTADMVLGGLWMLFLLSIAQKVFGFILPPFSESKESDDLEKVEALKGPNPKSIAYSIGVTLLILGVCVGISILLFDKMDEIFIILGVTTVSLAVSFNQKIRNIRGSFLVGEYFVLLFCIGLGSLSNFQELLNSGSLYIGFTGVVMFTGIIIHLILAKIFKIDTDTFIITSTACLYGPAFVGPIANSLKNKKVILSGMTAGTLGYAVANYWGILFAEIIGKLF